MCFTQWIFLGKNVIVIYNLGLPKSNIFVIVSHTLGNVGQWEFTLDKEPLVNQGHRILVMHHFKGDQEGLS